MKTKKKVRGARAKNMDKLIAAVQARECLWDKSYRGHRNRFKLERYWNEVAAEVGLSSVNCRKQWKNLKDQCRKEMKKNPDHSDWPHFHKLQFIHNHFLIDEDEDPNDPMNSLDESIQRPNYTMRRKLLMNKRRNIDVDMDKLIEVVKVREIIWNRQLKGHHNWYKLDETWKEIAQEMGVTRDEARLKWKYLRDQARKEMRKTKSDWEFLPRLSFLTNQFNGYTTYELGDSENDNDNIQEDNYPEDDANFDDAHDAGESYYNVDHPPELTHFTDQYTEPFEHTSKGDEEFDEFDTKPVVIETDFGDEEERVRKDSEEPKDEDVGFFNSLIPHVKKLGPAKKLMLRMKMQELVYNTVYNNT